MVLSYKVFTKKALKQAVSKGTLPGSGNGKDFKLGKMEISEARKELRRRNR